MSLDALKNKTILIVSPESWGPNFVSKHHYATELSKRNNTVYFINPPSSKFDLHQVNENLYVCDYKPMVRGVNHLPSYLRDWIVGKDLGRLVGFLKLSKLDIVWSFDPFRFQNLNLFKAKKKIYHPVDIHFTKLEKHLTSSADIILASSQRILDRFADMDKPKFKIPHGLAEHFIKFTPKAYKENFSSDPGKIKVGYVGNLSYRFIDKDTLLNIVQSNKEIDFYFVGPYKSNNLSSNVDLTWVNSLERQSNCYLLGELASFDLPDFLHQMDMFLMCYRGDEFVKELANPHKILEYLSTGKVTVAHYIDEYKGKKQLVEMVEKNSELMVKFQKVVGHLDDYNSSEKSTVRKKFASNHSYVSIIERISTILSTNYH